MISDTFKDQNSSLKITLVFTKDYIYPNPFMEQTSNN